MKVIIIDGPDNTGKNMVIHDLLEHYDSVKIIHCHKPENSADDPLPQGHHPGGNGEGRCGA